MAIITDPDLLNRNEVIYGTSQQKLSFYPAGAVVSGVYDPELSDGATAPGYIFSSSTGQFIVAGVSAGDILSIKTGDDAGHWTVSGVLSNTVLRVFHIDDGEFGVPTDWVNAAATSLVYDIRDPTGGNGTDGATEQAIYSFTKEEWRTDGETFGGDDLIRHEFPYEPLTKESFEIGGGLSHADWNHFSNDTTERIRTGGWDAVDATSFKLLTYAGVITLGTLDSDAQAYYQPSGIAADPIDFVLTGAVNQAIVVHDTTGLVTTSGFDTRSFLKIFVRKKARTYDQSELSDIGVTQLENIVNRFPLTHVSDAAITATDAELVGNTPWTNYSTTNTGSNGVTADVDTVTGTFTAAGENFTSTVVVGDVLNITNGTNDTGYYEVLSVDSNTQLTVDTSELGGFTGESSLTYETHTRIIISQRTNDGTIDETATAGSGLLTSLTGGFSGVVAPNDILRILEPGASGLEGVYKITDINSDTELGINTSDQAFPDSPADQIDYEILEPGMFLQKKAEDLPLSSTGDLTFTANTRPTLDTIDRASGSWITDGVTEGDVITIAGSASNDGSYVVRTVVSAAQIEVDTQHVLVTEGPVSATATVVIHFKRTINSVIYPFSWRCFGNNATLSEVYEFVQRELRRVTDIDNGPGISRGDVTDLLMTYSFPTGRTLDMYIDDLDANDLNNVTYEDVTGVVRSNAFVAAGTIVHNQNLIDDTDAVVRMFFTTNPGGNFSTSSAIIVNDADGVPISYNVSGTSSHSFTFDYDNNTQGGRTASTDADVTIVAIGLNNAQYVLFQGTITRTTGLTFSLVASLERNYSNP